MIPYHGTPITPESVALEVLRRRHAFVSFAHPQQLGLAAQECRSFALDNGAFSFWKAGKTVDWPGFYAWVAKWMRHPRFDFAVIPDVIEGSEAENDALLSAWPFGPYAGAPVWHVNESTERLIRLALTYPRVCIGSSGEFDVSSPRRFLDRMREVLPTICDRNGFPVCKLHGLRMLNPVIFSQLPLSSADSTNVARNVGIDQAWKGTYQPSRRETRGRILAERIEAHNSACRMDPVGLL